MAFFRKKPPQLPNYAASTLDALLADPVWVNPIREAGFSVLECDLIRRVDEVLIADPRERFSNGMPFAGGEPGILMISAGTLGIAFPDRTRIVVLSRHASKGRLMLTRHDAVQIVFGRDGADDGWTFTNLKKGSPDGEEFGKSLLKFVVSG